MLLDFNIEHKCLPFADFALKTAYVSDVQIANLLCVFEIRSGVLTSHRAAV